MPSPDITTRAVQALPLHDANQDLIVIRARGPLLFRNLGKREFQLRPDAFCFANPPQGSFTGTAVGDYDRDGWPDLYVVNDFGRKNLYRNNGDGTFTDVAEEVGVLDIGPGMSCCWFDYDNDGNQDLYVSDMWEPAGMRVSTQQAFMKDEPEPIRALYRRHAKGNSLFHNQGNGNFEGRSAAAGVEKAAWSWSCSAWDFDCGLTVYSMSRKSDEHIILYSQS